MSVESLVKEWMAIDYDAKTKEEIQSLVDAGKTAELEARLSQANRLVFGTAGLRGPLRAGYDAMNEVVVRQAAQGLAKYIMKIDADAQKKPVIIGHDARHKSLQFAHITAAAFMKQGIPVRLFSKVVPTPFVPYMVRLENACCGVIVTASHNPAQDNGYKVVAPNGAQIISPMDGEIQDSIMENLAPWEGAADYEETVKAGLKDGRINDPLQDCLDNYLRDAREKLCFNGEEFNRESGLKFVYSAMHGVGYDYINAIVPKFGFDLEKTLIPVECQVLPDPSFPTAAKPNPERPENLKIGQQVADEHGAKLIFANDPDADRLAVAEKTENGWKVLHGNEIGALLAWWMFENLKDVVPREKMAMVNSTVSSKFIAGMAKKEGFQYHDVLTGFKNIGNKALALKEEGVTTIFSFEEAIGFSCYDLVFDKDGVTALACCAELAAKLYSQGSTLTEQLDKLGETYGHYAWNNTATELDDLSLVDKVFEHLKNGGKGIKGHGHYVAEFGSFKVADIRDQQDEGLDTRNADAKTSLPTSSVPMITYYFENGAVLTLRPSGTEPLLKKYIDACASTKEEANAIAKSVGDAFDEVVMSLLKA